MNNCNKLKSLMIVLIMFMNCVILLFIFLLPRFSENETTTYMKGCYTRMNKCNKLKYLMIVLIMFIMIDQIVAYMGPEGYWLFIYLFIFLLSRFSQNETSYIKGCYTKMNNWNKDKSLIRSFTTIPRLVDLCIYTEQTMCISMSHYIN
jgi:hypothetical protein